MKVLVVNAGSSSVKFSLIDIDSSETLSSGIVGRASKRRPSTAAGRNAKSPK